MSTSSFWAHVQPLAPKATGVKRVIEKLFRQRKERDDTSSLARRTGKKYRPGKPPPPQSTASTRITSFDIETTFLLFPGAAGWTFSLLDHSPLVSLHISGLNVSRSDWDQIASKLADVVPNLFDLHFDDLRISPDCFMRLLNRLSRLTSLTIGSCMSAYLTHPRLFLPFSAWYIPAFRSLSKLSAPTSYVSLFLMRRNPLPALTTMALPPIDIYQISTSHNEPFYIHLPEIFRRLRDIDHSLSPLCINITLGWMGLENLHLLSRHIDISLALDVEDLRPLNEITHLGLENFNSLIEARCLSRWLRLFPSLQQVSWCDPVESRALVANIPHLAREIFRACPTIETITAQGVEYSIPNPAAFTETYGAPSACVLIFSELPTEVLMLICDVLQDADLVSLSLLCRRFHFLALPLFLARNSIRDPDEPTVVHVGDTNVLRALTVALFVPTIKYLVCVFPNPVYVHHHLDEINRVTRLVKKLATVGSLSLEFGVNSYRLGHVSWAKYAESRLWDACYSALSDLLDMAGRKSCTSLSILGCPAPLIQPLPPAQSARVTSVTHLSLGVIRPTAYSWWICAALKDSPITSLTLHATDKLDLESVASVSSALLTLLIYGDYAPRTKILNFLSKCSHLTTLKLSAGLSKSEFISTVQAEPPALRFDTLVDLAAPVAYISHFLHGGNPFPGLRRLDIFLDDLGDVGVCWTLISLIERLHECSVSPPAITVVIKYLRDLSHWIDSVAYISAMGGKWTHAARHITGLKLEYEWRLSLYIYRGPGLLDPDTFELLLSWLGLFIGVRSISIRMPQSPTVYPLDSPTVFVDALAGALPSVQVSVE
ncbi:hypothetical protein C8R43DRAFT_1010491 [Mycena crocata]|nr:hypothetical protein C8R43DRAFT_1010491 [Mycena crocata]